MLFVFFYLLAKGGGLLSIDEDKRIGCDSSDKPSEDDGCKMPDDDADVPIVSLIPSVVFFI